MSHVLSTESVAPRHRVAFWQEMVCQTFVQALCGSSIGESFRGQIVTENFGDSEISRIDAGRQRIDRRATDIARCSKPRYYLCYQAAGNARFVERHSDNVVSAGDMVLLDNCEPYSAEYDDTVTEIVLQIPHDVLRERFRHPDRCVGRKLNGQRAVTKITAAFLASLAAQADTLSDSQRALTAQMALNLLSELLVEETTGEMGAGTHQAILMARIKQYVLSRLGDPQLSVDGVASGVGLSARYVSRLFQAQGETFGRYLLRERVNLCKRELTNPSLQTQRVSEIALRSGFNNLSHFSRVFRDCVGQSPSDYREVSRNVVAVEIANGPA